MKDADRSVVVLFIWYAHVIYSPGTQPEVNNSRIPEGPHNNQLIFHMAEVDKPMKNKYFCLISAHTAFSKLTKQLKLKMPIVRTGISTWLLEQQNMFCVVFVLHSLQY